MAFGAKIDEGRFEAGFNPGDAAFVDVGFLLFAGAGFDVQVEKTLSVYQGDAQLFRVSCIDQHAFHGKKRFLSLGFDRKPGGVRICEAGCACRGLHYSSVSRRPDPIRPLWGAILLVQYHR